MDCPLQVVLCFCRSTNIYSILYSFSLCEQFVVAPSCFKFSFAGSYAFFGLFVCFNCCSVNGVFVRHFLIKVHSGNFLAVEVFTLRLCILLKNCFIVCWWFPPCCPFSCNWFLCCCGWIFYEFDCFSVSLCRSSKRIFFLCLWWHASKAIQCDHALLCTQTNTECNIHAVVKHRYMWTQFKVSPLSGLMRLCKIMLQITIYWEEIIQWELWLI